MLAVKGITLYSISSAINVYDNQLNKKRSRPLSDKFSLPRQPPPDRKRKHRGISDSEKLAGSGNHPDEPRDRR
jgi:hypothetical protein